MATESEKSSIFELEDAYNQYRNRYLNRYYNNFKEACKAVLDLTEDIDFTPEDLINFYNTILIKYDLVSDNKIINNIHKTFRGVLIEKLSNKDKEL